MPRVQLHYSRSDSRTRARVGPEVLSVLSYILSRGNIQEFSFFFFFFPRRNHRVGLNNYSNIGFVCFFFVFSFRRKSNNVIFPLPLSFTKLNNYSNADFIYLFLHLFLFCHLLITPPTNFPSRLSFVIGQNIRTTVSHHPNKRATSTSNPTI